MKITGRKLTPDEIASSGSEHAHQAAVFSWVADMMNENRYLELDALHATPNGGKRTGQFGSGAAGARMKAEGVRKGFPDMSLPVSRRGYHALFIEMKVGRNKPDDYQITWLNRLTTYGNLCAVCYSWRQAAAVLSWYVGNDWVTKKPDTIWKIAVDSA